MRATTTHHDEFNSQGEVEAAIEGWEAERGGAWAYEVDFGRAYITVAHSPSRLPDRLAKAWGGRQQVYYRGQWRPFSEAAIIREQNRGLGDG